MKNRENVFIIARFFLIGFLPLLFVSCVTMKAPEYRCIENFEVTRLSPKTEFNLDVKLFNPNPAGGKLKEIYVHVKVFNSEMNIDTRNTVRIPANSDFVLPIHGETTVENAAEVLKMGFLSMLGGKPEIPVDVDGYIIAKKFIFRKKINFEFNEKIALDKIKLPK